MTPPHMIFTRTCHYIDVEVSEDKSPILYADAQKNDGDLVKASLNLNEGIGNDNGKLSRQLTGFGHSATDIHRAYIFNDFWLVAELIEPDGYFGKPQRIRFNDIVRNNDGNIEWIEN